VKKKQKKCDGHKELKVAGDGTRDLDYLDKVRFR